MRRDAVPPDANLSDQRVLDLLDRQLGRYQEIVGRLASASAQVKTWCVTVLGALVAVAVAQDKVGLLGVGAGLLVPFGYLDAYYLALERGFRRASQSLVSRVAANELSDWTELVQVEAPSTGSSWRSLAACARSTGIWPFYVALGVLLVAGTFAV